MCGLANIKAIARWDERQAMRGRDDDAFVTPETSLSLVLHYEASTVTNSNYCVRHDFILAPASLARSSVAWPLLGPWRDAPVNNGVLRRLTFPYLVVGDSTGRLFSSIFRAPIAPEVRILSCGLVELVVHM
jgi:hypothetical protein